MHPTSLAGRYAAPQGFTVAGHLDQLFTGLFTGAEIPQQLLQRLHRQLFSPDPAVSGAVGRWRTLQSQSLGQGFLPAPNPSGNAGQPVFPSQFRQQDKDQYLSQAVANAARVAVVFQAVQKIEQAAGIHYEPVGATECRRISGVDTKLCRTILHTGLLPSDRRW